MNLPINHLKTIAMSISVAISPSRVRNWGC